MIGHSLQSIVADPFPVQTCHVVIHMAHDCIHSNLIPASAANRFERMSQCIEADPRSLQLKQPQKLVEGIANLVDVAFA